MNVEQLDREEMINAIWASRGKVSAAAKRLNCSARTIFAYAKKYATVQQAIDEARREWDTTLLDLAEIKLYTQVEDGRAWAIRYTLDRKGHERGYTENHEHNIGGELVIKIVNDKNITDHD